MCHVHGVFALRSLLRGVFLVLLGGLLNVCAQAQEAPTESNHADCHNLHVGKG